MREVQPNRPYFIGGRSLGGMIAFEMAHQLRVKARRLDYWHCWILIPADTPGLLRCESGTARAVSGAKPIFQT